MSKIACRGCIRRRHCAWSCCSAFVGAGRGTPDISGGLLAFAVRGHGLSLIAISSAMAATTVQAVLCMHCRFGKEPASSPHFGTTAMTTYCVIFCTLAKLSLTSLLSLKKQGILPAVTWLHCVYFHPCNPLSLCLQQDCLSAYTLLSMYVNGSYSRRWSLQCLVTGQADMLIFLAVCALPGVKGSAPC